ncbi:MAG: IclR family transcriptional regulator, partial [Deltaproteobacteria bacterium]|nr:IclR family transcriptional regulator [Deltaproteobacteria bacterium]
VTAVGVPVYGPDGVVIAAISIASISDRMGKKRVADIVKTTQEKIIDHH